MAALRPSIKNAPAFLYEYSRLFFGIHVQSPAWQVYSPISSAKHAESVVGGHLVLLGDRKKTGPQNTPKEWAFSMRLRVHGVLQWHAIVSWFVAVLLIAFGAVALTPSSANAVATPVPLGTAQSFGVLGGSTVTNTGPSVVQGDLGVSPGTAITGFPPGTVLGAIHDNDAVAAQAQADLTTAYNQAAGQPCDEDLTGQDLGGLTLTPGVYCFDTSAQLTGALTLDAEGNPNAVFVFQIGSTLTTASASSVNLINGASPCNVFWQVGSSATLGTDTDFVGTIMALTSITLNNGADINGRALARNGAVTMDTNDVNASNCSSATNGGTTTAGTDGGTRRRDRRRDHRRKRRNHHRRDDRRKRGDHHHWGDQHRRRDHNLRWPRKRRHHGRHHHWRQHHRCLHYERRHDRCQHDRCQHHRCHHHDRWRQGPAQAPRGQGAPRRRG